MHDLHDCMFERHNIFTFSIYHILPPLAGPRFSGAFSILIAGCAALRYFGGLNSENIERKKTLTFNFLTD
jgi:hypothetical protein